MVVTYISPVLILYPSPTYGIFDFEFNSHTLFGDVGGMLRIFLVLFWSQICVRVKRFRVDFNKVGHPNNPHLIPR
jgi:hypothetical protein